MIYAYLRYSTDSQDEMQQIQGLKEWAEPRGITIDVIEKDEGVSGGVSYRDRKLYGLLRKMKPGDTLLTTEISRLGRSMADISKMLSQELKPRKIRLVVTKMGIDVDCSNLKATDEFVFSALSFAAQIEKELIQSRTQSALDARRDIIRQEGGFFSKNGNWVTHLGAAKGADMSAARRVSSILNTESATAWRTESPLYMWVERQVFRGRSQKEILEGAVKLYEQQPDKYCTRKGKPLCGGTLSRWVKEIQRA